MGSSSEKLCTTFCDTKIQVITENIPNNSRKRIVIWRFLYVLHMSELDFFSFFRFTLHCDLLHIEKAVKMNHVTSIHKIISTHIYNINLTLITNLNKIYFTLYLSLDCSYNTILKDSIDWLVVSLCHVSSIGENCLVFIQVSLSHRMKKLAINLCQ